MRSFQKENKKCKRGTPVAILILPWKFSKIKTKKHNSKNSQFFLNCPAEEIRTSTMWSCNTNSWRNAEVGHFTNPRIDFPKAKTIGSKTKLCTFLINSFYLKIKELKLRKIRRKHCLQFKNSSWIKYTKSQNGKASQKNHPGYILNPDWLFILFSPTS